MLVQKQVGPITATSSISAGTLAPGRMGNMGDDIVSELHGKYYETTYRRNRFTAANPTGVTGVAFTSGTTTVVLGVIVSNPIGSTINMVLDKVGFSFPVINTTVNTVILGVGYSGASAVTHTTALTIKNNFIGVGASGQGFADSAATVPVALTTFMQLSSMPSATTLPAPSLFDLDGSIILPPGAYAALITSAATAVSGFQGSISWEEVPA